VGRHTAVERRRVILRLLTLPFRLAGAVVSVLYVAAFVEGFGLFVYLRWTGTLDRVERLLVDGTSPGELAAFASARPELVLVAAGLGVLSVVLAATSDSSGRSGSHVGGFGGDGGDGGDGGE
jgi:hypothetical protein